MGGRSADGGVTVESNGWSGEVEVEGQQQKKKENNVQGRNNSLIVSLSGQLIVAAARRGGGETVADWVVGRWWTWCCVSMGIMEN